MRMVALLCKCITRMYSEAVPVDYATRPREFSALTSASKAVPVDYATRLFVWNHKLHPGTPDTPGGFWSGSDAA
jgi:hypothetical protein